VFGSFQEQVNVHCHCPTSLTIAVTSWSCIRNVLLAISKRCSSAPSLHSISVAAGAVAALGAAVASRTSGSFAFRVFLTGVFLTGVTGAKDALEVATGDPAGDAATGDAGGMGESLNFIGVKESVNDVVHSETRKDLREHKLLQVLFRSIVTAALVLALILALD